MGQSIVQIRQMGDALRSSGYKSIDSAVAELIDNSIEAEAHDIFVIMTEHIDPQTNRKSIYEFAILDNGYGMDISKLACCLGIGFTTKSDRRGMGRFGVGLPQASLHVTPSVEVYSWTDEIEKDDTVYQVWLDINKVKTGEQEEINDPELQEIPNQYRKFLKYKTQNKTYDFTQHGTLVYWKNCDNVKPKTMASLNSRFEFSLGRKFRYLIYQGTHNIRLITIGHEDQAIDVLPNDPMFLMKPNYVLGNPNDAGHISERMNINCTEPIFEKYKNAQNSTGSVTIPIPYRDRITGEEKTSDVVINFSKVRAEFYDQTAIPVGNPGITELGKFAKKLEGISVIRAKREIDFGVFDFYDRVNNPNHRWWGCEILFDPVLDEAFGVSNNKQQVELHDDGPTRDIDTEETLWETLYRIIHPTIMSMVDANKELRKGSRNSTKDGGIEPTQTENIIQAVEEDLEDQDGVSKEERNSTTEEEREDRARNYLIETGIENPTIAQIKSILEKAMTITYKRYGRNSPFIDTDFSLGNVTVIINTEHIFYNEFIVKMADEDRVAFELFIGAFAKAIDKTNIHNSDQNDQLISEWNNRLVSYLRQIRQN